jgi:ABC-type nitrate/sulfonate/bicarbonate transport system substrate-binding protein
LLTSIVMANAASAAEQVIFHPGWFASAQFAGIFVALDLGFYREAGLEVDIQPFAYGQNSPAVIDTHPEICALGSIEGYILLEKRGTGVDLKALAAMLQESPAGYMSLASAKINQVHDFSGRRIGVHKFADGLYGWFMHQAALAPTDARMVFVGDDVSLLTRGEVDVMQGYATEEFIRLQDLVAGSGRFISFTSLGFPSYSEVLYTTADQTARHELTLRRFLAATRRGWTYAFAHPEIAIASVSDRLAAGSDRTDLRKNFAALQAYVCPGGQSPLAPMDPEKWHKVEQVGVEIGWFDRKEPVENFLLNW